MRERSFEILRVGELSLQFEVMIYGAALNERQPLLILHSQEYPMPPSAAFCEMMWASGYQVIFVRRPGYGRSSPIPGALLTADAVKSRATLMAEAAIIAALLKTMVLKNPILLAIGSANPVSYRLVHMLPNLALTIFANPVFNQDVWPDFEPAWFRNMLRQIITSRSGTRVARQGLRYMMTRDPVGFYETILQKNAEDLAYVAANKSDYEAAGAQSLRTTSEMLYYDVISCLHTDSMLKDDYFDGVNAVVLTGVNTTAHWRAEMERETARLDLPLVLAPAGDIFCAYASPETVLDLLHQQMSAPIRTAS